ncbi:hemerythrin domain-containing protein [bacterium]|nr:hemerythrin domain-containing protein [bacterium]
MDHEAPTTRRDFFRLASVLGAGLALSACMPKEGVGGAKALAASEAPVKADVEEVLPVEDLMREHGILRRILLIYREAEKRLFASQDVDPKILTGSAEIIRRFIEEYHEKLEEDYLFPHFERAGKLTDLVKVLKQQHEGGRRLTAEILAQATKAARVSEARRSLADALHAFVRMYEPHAAREDTVLFPAFRSVVTPKEYDQYGDIFEDKEKALFGTNGFENMVSQVADLEKAMGLYELSQFTPR